MAALSNSSVLHNNQLSYGSSQDFSKLLFGKSHIGNVQSHPPKRTLAIQAVYGGDGRSSNGAAFVGGFILGGLIVGTLGCVYAPQISDAIAGADKKELLRKLPNFIYDEEKALEKTRKKLAEKIAQLNTAIDDMSSQLRSDDDEESKVNGAAVPKETKSAA